jgi:hypothetical protein
MKEAKPQTSRIGFPSCLLRSYDMYDFSGRRKLLAARQRDFERDLDIRRRRQICHHESARLADVRGPLHGTRRKVIEAHIECYFESSVSAQRRSDAWRQWIDPR